MEGFESTYKELKHVGTLAGSKSCIVLSLPIRNWNKSVTGYSKIWLTASFESTYKELKLLQHPDLSPDEFVLSLPIRNWN